MADQLVHYHALEGPVSMGWYARGFGGSIPLHSIP